MERDILGMITRYLINIPRDTGYFQIKLQRTGMPSTWPHLRRPIFHSKSVKATPPGEED